MRKIERKAVKHEVAIQQFEMDAYTLVNRLASLGMSIPQMGKVLGIEPRSMASLIEGDDKFYLAYAEGKREPDMMVQRSLFRKACGYEYQEVTVTEHLDADDQLINKTVVTRNKHQSPDTSAAVFWLKNRMRSEWQDTFHSAVSLRDRAELAGRLTES